MREKKREREVEGCFLRGFDRSEKVFLEEFFNKNEKRRRSTFDVVDDVDVASSQKSSRVTQTRFLIFKLNFLTVIELSKASPRHILALEEKNTHLPTKLRN